MLKAHNLSYHYETSLFSSLCLEGGAGEIIAIMGVSGSGKSTLLHILSSFLSPNTGNVFLFNEDIYSLNTDKLLALRRSKIGVIFQNHYLFRGFNGVENLQIASLLSNVPMDYQLLEDFGISHILHQNVGSLSGGQQQRLSIARILTKKPSIIFADEPTGNLDKDTAFSVMDILFKYVKQHNALLIFVTHDITLAKRADKSYCLDNTQFYPI